MVELIFVLVWVTLLTALSNKILMLFSFQGVEPNPEPGTHNHNSDLRDSYSHEYIQKQVCGEQIFTRYQSSRRFDLVKTMLTDR